MNKVYIGLIFGGIVLSGYFIATNTTKVKIIKEKTTPILKVAKIKKIDLIKEKTSIDNEIKTIVISKVIKNDDLIENNKIEVEEENIYYSQALEDLKNIHNGDSSTKELLEKKAAVIAQILKVKHYYEVNLDKFPDSEYEKIFSIIERADVAYDDLLYISLDCKEFPSFFKEVNKIIITL